jgi:anti-sigma factor RsiW
MTTIQRPDDATLMAYVDGELDEAAVAAVDRAVAADPVLARQVHVLHESTAVLRAAFNAPLHEPIPERLLAPLGAQRAKPWRTSRAFRPLAMAAALGALIVGGTAFYANSSYELPFQVIARSQANWLNGIANYHVLYTRTAQRDERLLVDVNADDLAYLENWFGKRLKRDVRLPNLENQGFQIQGGRVMFVESQPAAQFFYKAANADDIISMTIAQTRRPDAAWTATKSNGLHMIYWRKNGYAYIFTTAADKHVLHNVASSFNEDQEKI